MNIERKDIEEATGVREEIKVIIEDRQQNSTHEVKIRGGDGRWLPIVGMNLPTRGILVGISDTESIEVLRMEIEDFRKINSTQTAGTNENA